MLLKDKKIDTFQEFDSFAGIVKKCSPPNEQKEKISFFACSKYLPCDLVVDILDPERLIDILQLGSGYTSPH